MNGEILLFHLMLKQGIMWFTLAAGAQETVYTNSKNVLSLKHFKSLTTWIIFPDGLNTTAAQYIVDYSVFLTSMHLASLKF